MNVTLITTIWKVCSIDVNAFICLFFLASILLKLKWSAFVCFEFDKIILLSGNRSICFLFYGTKYTDWIDYTDCNVMKISTKKISKRFVKNHRCSQFLYYFCLRIMGKTVSNHVAENRFFSIFWARKKTYRWTIHWNVLRSKFIHSYQNSVNFVRWIEISLWHMWIWIYHAYRFDVIVI